MSFVFLSFSATLNAQTTKLSTATTPTQASAALQNAIAALSGTAAVNDVTLTGTAEWIAGSDDETGTVTYQALAGANRLVLNLSNGPRNEIRSAAGPTGSWSGADAVFHPIAYHNLLVDRGWFPLFTLSAIASSPSTVVTYVGVETHNGSSVIHLSASQQLPNSTSIDPNLFQPLTQIDIYLDPNTFLPTSYVYMSHPDNNELVDIVQEVRYSNYQKIGGAQIPLHVQDLLNSCLDLDLQFQNSSVNTGLTAAPED